MYVWSFGDPEKSVHSCSLKKAAINNVAKSLGNT